MNERQALIRILNDEDPEGGVFDPDEVEEFWSRQADAILAAGFRLQSEPEWEYAVHTAEGEHIWPLGPQDEEIVETLAACTAALDDNDPDYWEPTDRIVRRRKAGEWEPVE